MRTKVTLVLLFLNVALFFVIFQFERSWRTESVARDVRKRVLGAEAADIRSLDVESAAPGGSFRLERRGDEWFLTKPIAWRANSNTVSRIVGDLEFLENDTSFSVPAVVKNGQSLADYGLAPPKMTVTFASGGPDTTGSAPVTTRLEIGEATKVGQRLYVLSPDGARIHVVGRELADSLSVPIEQLRDQTVLTIPVYEAKELNVQTAPPSGVHVIVQRDGARWSFYTPIAARASKDAIEMAISNLGGLKVKSFLAPNAPSPPAPQLQVTIEGNARYETLFIGVQAPGPSAPETHPYYAQLEDSSKPMDRSPWFIVDIPDKEPNPPEEPKSLLAVLRVAQESLRDRHVLDVDPNLVTMITLKAPNQADLTLQRLDPDTARAAPASEARWQILLPGDGAQGPATLSADRAAVQRLLAKIVLLSADRFMSDAPQESDLDDWGFNRPERTVTITQQPSSRNATPVSPLTLEIGRSTQRDDRYAYAMLANARSVYRVDPQILKDTPVAPREWRDRLVYSLPAPARITGLEIDDLKENKPVIRWDASSGAAPATVQAVVDGLRQVRAARFVLDGYADKVAVAGEERPWRYRLQVMVALPGAGASEQTGTHAIKIAERTGGAEQIAGSEEYGAVFVLEQPMVDALWKLIYGTRDPGPPPPKI